MYEQGFAQVNSKYNFVNRDVTNSQNLKVRDNFLKQAKLNLKDLSALDLSDDQNVMAASSVFEPFIKNTNVLGDQALTEHWNNQESIGESYRLKDGGKEFSEDNINYVRLQKQAFANDSPNSWNSYYQNKRSYTPYYDYNKEWNDLMKNFKPDEVSDFKMSGFYFIKEKEASVKPDAVKRYLEGTMSDKARQQIKIEAAVRYGTKPEQVAGVYQQVAQSSVKSLQDEIDRLNVDVKMQKDPAKKNQIKEYISTLEGTRDGYAKDVDRIKRGDVSFLKGKSEAIAYDIYYDQLVNRTATAYARKDYDRDITVNSAAVDVWKDGQVWARQKDQQDFELKKKAMEDGLGLGSGLSVDIPADEESIKQRTISDLNGIYSQINGNMALVSKDFSDYVLRYYKADGISDANDQLTIEDLEKNPKKLQEFIATHRGVKEVDDFIVNSNFYAQQKKNVENVVATARNEINASLTPEQKNSLNSYINQAKSFGDIVLTGYGNKKVRYSGDQIARGIVDGTVSTKFVGRTAVVTVDGKDFILDTKSNDNTVKDAINKINGIINFANSNGSVKDILTSYRNATEDYFVSKTALIDKAKVVGDDSKSGKLISSYVKGLVPLQSGTLDVTGIKISPTTNRTYFTISAGEKATILKKDGSTGSFDQDDIIDLLKAQGLKVGKSKVGGLYIENQNLINQYSIYKDYTPAEKSMAEFDNYAGNNYKSSFWYPLGTSYKKDPNTKQTYRLPAFRYEKTMSVGLDGYKKPKYYLYDDMGGAPLATYDDIHDLIVQAKALSSDLNSYVAIKKSTLR